MDGPLPQLIGSLVAILVLAGIAWALRLGPPPRIADRDDALARAREADTGFDPVDAAFSQGGETAILADTGGRIMVLRRHGGHFAGRVLNPDAKAAREGGRLTVIPADRRYGPVTLDLGDEAQAWESRIEALKGGHHA